MSVPVTIAEWREFLADSTVQWPETRPASEDAIRAAEQRLDVSLPPSYRNFLLVSDGWAEMPDDPGTLRTVDAIGWYPQTDPEMWEAWFGPDMPENPELESELKGSLLITTDAYRGDVWVLAPNHRDADGEWRAYEWWPADDGSLLPHDSFGALLKSARDKWAEKSEN
jgi:hypothetical protein